MAGDEEETKEPAPPLPGRVEQALARARAAAKADRARKGGRWLALFPLVIGIVFLALLMPRATPPDAVPLPRVDRRVLAKIAADEDTLARASEETRLPTDVLAVGSAFRALKGAEARNADSVEAAQAKRVLEGALLELQRRPNLEEDLLALRALQTHRFLAALRTWEERGDTTEDLTELGGGLIARLVDTGWATTSPRHILLDDAQRRFAFKAVWNALLDVERRPRFVLPLDEQRAMYTLYLEHPHAAESHRAALLAQRRAATSPATCDRANLEEMRQTELWRVEKIKRLGLLDPEYPTSYALGVALYRLGRYDLSADAFSAWLNDHPNGPYALRARNHLKAAILAGGA